MDKHQRTSPARHFAGTNCSPLLEAYFLAITVTRSSFRRNPHRIKCYNSGGPCSIPAPPGMDCQFKEHKLSNCSSFSRISSESSDHQLPVLPPFWSNG